MNHFANKVLKSKSNPRKIPKNKLIMKTGTIKFSKVTPETYGKEPAAQKAHSAII